MQQNSMKHLIKGDILNSHVFLIRKQSQTNKINGQSVRGAFNFNEVVQQ